MESDLNLIFVRIEVLGEISAILGEWQLSEVEHICGYINTFPAAEKKKTYLQFYVLTLAYPLPSCITNC